MGVGAGVLEDMRDQLVFSKGAFGLKLVRKW